MAERYAILIWSVLVNKGVHTVLIKIAFEHLPFLPLSCSFSLRHCQSHRAFSVIISYPSFLTWPRLFTFPFLGTDGLCSSQSNRRWPCLASWDHRQRSSQKASPFHSELINFLLSLGDTVLMGHVCVSHADSLPCSLSLAIATLCLFAIIILCLLAIQLIPGGLCIADWAMIPPA